MKTRPTQLTLGDLYTQLRYAIRRHGVDQRHANVYIKIGEDKLVSPRLELCSYRGYYADCAVVYSDEETSLDSFLDWLPNQVGSLHFGWKGGMFIMDSHTPIWAVDDEAHASYLAISGVSVTSDMKDLVIQTFDDSDYY